MFPNSPASSRWRAASSATPISNNPGEYLIWFRPERIRTVTWGGDPLKPFVIGDNPSDLSPRRSFAQWHQLVEGTSEPWTPADIAAARLIGQSVADIVLQFRAVRTLIAQDQLEQFSRQVRVSEQPVIIADIDGKILLMNEAFRTLLPKDLLAARLDDLAPAFQQPERFVESVARIGRSSSGLARRTAVARRRQPGKAADGEGRSGTALPRSRARLRAYFFRHHRPQGRRGRRAAVSRKASSRAIASTACGSIPRPTSFIRTCCRRWSRTRSSLHSKLPMAWKPAGSPRCWRACAIRRCELPRCWSI